MPATGLGWNSDYYLFKEGIKPMWEDPSNVNGGRWLVIVSNYIFDWINFTFHPKVDKQKRQNKLDSYWLEIMMAIIGEQFEELGEYICGAVVNVRQKGDKIALWTKVIFRKLLRKLFTFYRFLMLTWILALVSNSYTISKRFYKIYI